MNKQNLWAPWRIGYLKSVDDSQESKPPCFLCAANEAADRDRELVVIHRSEHGIVMLNRYPYTNGHMLVAPNQHLSDLTQMTPQVRTELMELTCLAEHIIQLALNPQGINVGINIGRAAGAGVPGHLHIHLVPRWSGDCNFIDVLGNVRVIPQSLEMVYDEFKNVLPQALDMMKAD